MNIRRWHWGLLTGVALLGLVGSGCVRYSYDSAGGGRRWGANPKLDEPRQENRSVRRHRRERSRWEHLRRDTSRDSSSPSRRQLRHRLRHARRVIRYCRYNRKKTIRILRRLRRSTSQTDDGYEFRTYIRLQRRYYGYLRRYQSCINKFRRRYVQLRAQIRGVAGQRPHARRRMFAQRAPLQPNNPTEPANPNAPHNPSDNNGNDNAPGDNSGDSDSSGGSDDAAPKKAAPRAQPHKAPTRRAAPTPHGLAGGVPPTFPLYRPPARTPLPNDNLSSDKPDGVEPDTDADRPARRSKPQPKASAPPAKRQPSPGAEPKSQPGQAPSVEPKSPHRFSSQSVVPPRSHGPHGSAVQPIPAPTLPPVANTPALLRWRRFCSAEVRKSSPVQAFKSLGTRALGSSIKVKTFKHTTNESIQALHGSGSRYVVLSSKARYSQAHCGDREYVLWDTQTHKVRRVRPAITAYLLRHRYLLPWFQGKKHTTTEEQLVSFRPRLGRGGVVLRAPIVAWKKRYRSVYLVWDLKRNQVVRTWTLGTPGCHGAYRPIGTDPHGRTFFYLMNERAVNGSCADKSQGGSHFYRVMALDLNSGRRRSVARIAPANIRVEALVPTRDFSRIAVVQYTELKGGGRAFVIDTRSGKVRRYPAPITPYGVAFSADQKALLMYSAKKGKLVRISLANGKRTAHKTFRLGHALGLSSSGKRLYLVFHSGVEVRDATSLKRIQFLPHRPMMGKTRFVHVGGSAVYGGTLFIKNGDKLYVRRTL